MHHRTTRPDCNLPEVIVAESAALAAERDESLHCKRPVNEFAIEPSWQGSDLHAIIAPSREAPYCLSSLSDDETMALVIRDVREHELDSVHALNNAAGQTILPLDALSIRAFFEQAAYFRVAESDGHLAGFLIALREDAQYDSPNFLWFRDHYPQFLYIDRIVIAQRYRGLGLGRIFYADVTSFAEVRVPSLACEVFLEPRDDVSVLFHGTYGFQEVGQQLMPGVRRHVSLLAKDLCSFAFVQRTYLDSATGALPAQSWLAGRAHSPAPAPTRIASAS